MHSVNLNTLMFLLYLSWLSQSPIVDWGGVNKSFEQRDQITLDKMTRVAHPTNQFESI